MKTSKKFFLALTMTIAGLTSANAQCDYLLDYGPGSIAWSWQMQQQINAMSAQTAAASPELLSAASSRCDTMDADKPFPTNARRNDIRWRICDTGVCQ